MVGSTKVRLFITTTPLCRTGLWEVNHVSSTYVATRELYSKILVPLPCLWIVHQLSSLQQQGGLRKLTLLEILLPK